MSSTFSHALVRPPCPGIIGGLTTAGLGAPSYPKALEQHAAYVEALARCGLRINVLPALTNFPDSTFIEDVALLTPACAVVTRPGVRSRRDETTGMTEVLAEFYPAVERIDAPGTVEAGDIMQVGNHFYIGLTERTNPAGAEQMIDILRRHGLDGSTVTVGDALHLKSCVSYLENRNLLIWEDFPDRAAFRDLDPIDVAPAEAYAANSLWVNGTVLVPAGFPATKSRIEGAGYPVIELDVSEFRKVDGGLSCLSLRFTLPGGAFTPGARAAGSNRSR